MDTMPDIQSYLDEHRAVFDTLSEHRDEIGVIAKHFIKAFNEKKKVLLCGNGGSAADAQHVAAEFVGRFKRERRALPAIALTTDTSILTALSNDYSVEHIFARQVEALAQPGDVVVGISTSGNSKNVLQAMSKARSLGCVTVGFTGKGGMLKRTVDVCFCVPSEDTARIQEAHIFVWHVISDLIEQEFEMT